MNKTIISTLTSISRLIPLGLYPKIVRREVIDFFYHAVSDDPMPHVRHLYPVVSTAVFENALLYLKENHTFIDYSQLHAHVFEGEPLPPKAVHISFDDGYAEGFSVVRPLLLKHGIPCTFFITTGLTDNPILFYRNKQSLCVECLTDPTFGFLPFDLTLPASAPALTASTLPAFISWFKDLRLPDEPLIEEICRALGVDWQAFLTKNQPYLTSEQIRQMHAEGFSMGAHTLTHRKLLDLPAAEIDNEIAESCRIVGDITGQEIVPFSFPHSAWGLDRRLLSDIRSRHPEIGLLFDTKGLRRDEKFIHNRVWAERLSPHPAWERECGGVRELLHLAYQEAWVDEILGWGRKLHK